MSRRQTIGQGSLVCEGLVDDTSSVEDMLQLWAVRIAEATDAAADLDRYLIERARSRS